MLKFLILLTASVFCLSTNSVKADDGDEIARVSVRLYHDLCMAKIFDQKEGLEKLDQFPKLIEDRANVFREMMQTGPSGEVWAIGFPKANFVLVFDNNQKACHLIGPRVLPVAAIEKEFADAATGMKKSGVAKVTQRPATKKGFMWTLSVDYDFPAKSLRLMNLASVRVDGENNGVGTVYTMVLKGIPQ